MGQRARLWIAVFVGASVVGAAAPFAAIATARSYREITATTLGRSMAAAAAERRSTAGIPTTSSALRVWELGADDHLVAERFPSNLTVSSRKNADGTTTQTMSFVAAAASGVRRDRTPPIAKAAAAAASWGWVDQACFSRRGSTTTGWLDVCYAIHRLNGETDPRDFYQLEQYGTLGAGWFTKMYRGSLETTAAPGSAPMSWIDWNPRSNHSGGCTNLNLIVKALGISITSPAEFCETVTPTKYQAAGHFKIEWSCGCIPPFGQPYPNSRELDAMQAVSVPGGGRPSWVLGYAYTFL